MEQNFHEHDTLGMTGHELMSCIKLFFLLYYTIPTLVYSTDFENVI